MSRGAQGLAVLLAALSTACATVKPRSPLFERVGKSDLSVGALRTRVRDMARRFPAVLETAADEIAERSGEEEMRRTMLEFKSNAVPAMQGALLQPDPVASLVDAWALLAQLQDVLPQRAAHAPPELIAHAHKSLEGLEGEVEALWKELSGNEDVSQARERVHAWAAEHPLTGPLITRESTVPLLATVTDISRVSPLGAAAILMEDTRDIATRVDLYAASLPREARWQAELLMGQAASAPSLQSAVDDMGRTVDILDRMGGLAERVPALVARERVAVLDGLDRSRLSLQEFASGERKALMTDVAHEREAVLAALHTERVEALQQIDAMGDRWVDHTFDRTDRLVDRVFRWLLALTGLLVLGGLLLTALLVWGWRRTRASLP
ncbi:MAG: chemotaxis protein [Hyalangium sp.]|uniref:chemotaxis protein n=1 Tax=Hyalangium sp. TaxID=2028555 RepID=UPI0038998381